MIPNQRILRCFAVPTHNIGASHESRTVMQRGKCELEYIRAFEHAHAGVHLERSHDAAYVELREQLQQMGVL